MTFVRPGTQGADGRRVVERPGVHDHWYVRCRPANAGQRRQAIGIVHIQFEHHAVERGVHQRPNRVREAPDTKHREPVSQLGSQPRFGTRRLMRIVVHQQYAQAHRGRGGADQGGERLSF